MKLIFPLLVILLFASPTFAADIVVNSGGDVQAAIDGASCGDTISLEAGATFDAPGAFQQFDLPNKSCSAGTPITIRSTMHASLPNGRVSPSNAALMPRLRAIGSGSHVFSADADAGYWILDGLELTDNITGNVESHSALDYSAAGVHHMTVTRCYIHQKELNPDYSRHLIRAMQWEGTYLTFKWNHAGPFHGYYWDGTTLMTTEVIQSLSALGPTLIEDNWMESWYASVFLGGGDTQPAHTATVSAATFMSATLSSVTSLTVGTIIRFDVGGACVADSPNCRTAVITNIAGNNITYTSAGAGPQALNSDSPDEPGEAAWCVGDEGLVNDVTIRRNTFNIDATFAATICNGGPSDSCPKGTWEVKNANRMIVEGNTIMGFPGAMAWALFNQSGTAPWTTIKHVTVRNNFFRPDSYPALNRIMALISLEDSNGKTATVGSDIQIYNNLVLNVNGFLQTGQGTDWGIYHNTVLNTKAGGSNFVNIVGVSNDVDFRDNIGAYQTYGLNFTVAPNTFSTNWTSSVALKNVMVDNLLVGGITTSLWGADSILSPVPTTLVGAGFVDLTTCLTGTVASCALAGGSAYKGDGTGGSDPGADIPALIAALGNTQAQLRISGKVTIRGSVRF